MSTVVFLHAHPDDEAIATGGTMARLAAGGHRVVLVVATQGELGKPREGVLAEGEALGERRAREARAAGELLGASRVEFLGYHDSGMMGDATNDDPGTFWTADVDEAARRLAVILDEEHADVLVVYDDHGAYGHPDHIQVHRVGIRAAELAGTPRVYESTINRDHVRRWVTEAAAEGRLPGDITAEEVEELGTPEASITTAVDVRSHLAAKRTALTVHESQIGPEDLWMVLSDEEFGAVFGTEWFIRRDVDRATHREDWLLDGLAPR